jgi:hypothetical protein
VRLFVTLLLIQGAGYLFLPLLGSAGVALCQAQPPGVEFSGQVWDTEADEGVPFVQVLFPERDTGCTTNLDGDFAIVLPPGRWAVAITALGFEPYTDTVDLTQGPVRNRRIVLQPKQFQATEVVIRYENPAIPIMREAIRRKRENRNADLDAYQVECYNKLTLVADNITPEKLDNTLWLRPFRDFLRTHQHDSALVDTNQRLRLTFFISESITDIAFQAPNRTREWIRATRTSGVQSEESNVLSGTFTDVNVYDNYITILGKQLVGPLAGGAFLSYEFVKMGEEYEGPDTLHIIELRPHNRYDPSFVGRIWIHSGSYAIRKADLRLSGAPVVNFVENIRIRQEFRPVNGKWLMATRDSEVNFANRPGNVGLLGRNVTHFRNYNLEPQFPPGYFSQELVATQEGAGQQDSAYWANNRLAPLERSDVLGYQLIGELETSSFWKWVRIASEVLTAGSKRLGNYYLGPYSRVVGYNPVEGFRTQVGFYSHPDFHPRYFFSVYAAYGFKDERFKYGAEGRVKLNLKPRVELTLRRQDGIEQLGMSNYGVSSASFLNSLLMRVPLYNQNYFRENYAALDVDVMRGLAARFTFQTKSFDPAFPYYRFAFRHPTDPTPCYRYDIAEAGLWLRVSFRENYVIKRHEKIYMDTEIPQFYLEGHRGITGVLGSDFAYWRAKITLQDRLKLGRFGWMTYTASVGKVWGHVPYPSLFVFRGSQSYNMTTIGYSVGAFQSFSGGYNRTAMYDEVGFNLMYFYEFCADEFAVLGLDHHLGGWLLRKLPLIRRLQFKEVFSFRGGWGRLSPGNRQLNTVMDRRLESEPVQQTVQAPDGRPYVEVGVGLENILKFIRVDYVWRLTYRNPQPTGRLAGFGYNHGVRFSIGFGF